MTMKGVPGVCTGRCPHLSSEMSSSGEDRLWTPPCSGAIISILGAPAEGQRRLGGGGRSCVTPAEVAAVPRHSIYGAHKAMRAGHSCGAAASDVAQAGRTVSALV